MQETSNLNNKTRHYDDDIDLKELFKVLWQDKLTIISFTAFISIITVIYSLLLPNIYQSNAILTPSSSSDSISSGLQRYSSLAGLAGINLSSGGDQSNASQAMTKLKSLSFFEHNILPNIFLPDLMAFAYWDHKTNTLHYDEDVYDISSNTWIRNSNDPAKYIPTVQQSFSAFTNLVQLNQDKRTGFVNLSIKHQSPFIAKQWIELMVNQINLYYREKDKLEASKAVSFLNEQVNMTNFTEIKQAISQLLKNETQKLSLVEAKQNYVFDYIDPPAVMEEKAEPKRSLICILGALLGGLFSVMYVLLNYFINGNRVS